MKNFKVFIMTAVCAFSFACASSQSSNLESARVALDNGDYDKAVEKANEVLAEDAQNVDATRIKGSALFALGEFSFLGLAADVIDIDSDSVDAFRDMADAFPDIGDHEKINLAVNAFDALEFTPITDELKDAAYDLGLMQAIGQFAIPSYVTEYVESGVADPSLITQDDVNLVLEYLIAFDDNLETSGISSDEDYIREVRHTLCVLKDITAEDGFTLGEYRAYIGCQLDEDHTIDTTEYSADIADCAQIDPQTQSESVQSCYEENTTL